MAGAPSPRPAYGDPAYGGDDVLKAYDALVRLQASPSWPSAQRETLRQIAVDLRRGCMKQLDLFGDLHHNLKLDGQSARSPASTQAAQLREARRRAEHEAARANSLEERLRATQAGGNSRADDSGDVRLLALRRENQRLLEENERLKEEERLRASEAKQLRVSAGGEAAGEELQTLRAENKRLRLLEGDVKWLNILEVEVRSLREGEAKLQAELKTLRSAGEGADGPLEGLRRELEDVRRAAGESARANEAEVSRLRAAASEEAARLLALSSEVSRLEGLQAEAGERFRGAEEARARAEEDASGLLASAARAKDLEAEVAALRGDLDRARARAAAAEEEAAAVAAAAAAKGGGAEELEAEVSRLRGELNRATVRAEEEAGRLAGLEEEATGLRHDNIRVRMLEEEKEGLAAELERLHERAEGESERLRALEGPHGKVRELELQVERLKGVEKQSKKLKADVKRVSELEQQVEQLKRAASRGPSPSRLAALEEENRELGRKEEKAREMARAAEAEAEKQRAAGAEAKRMREEMEAELEEIIDLYSLHSGTPGRPAVKEEAVAANPDYPPSNPPHTPPSHLPQVSKHQERPSQPVTAGEPKKRGAVKRLLSALKK